MSQRFWNEIYRTTRAMSWKISRKILSTTYVQLTINRILRWICSLNTDPVDDLKEINRATDIILSLCVVLTNYTYTKDYFVT